MPLRDLDSVLVEDVEGREDLHTVIVPEKKYSRVTNAALQLNILPENTL